MHPLTIQILSAGSGVGVLELWSLGPAAAMCHREERDRLQNRVIVGSNQHTPVGRNETTALQLLGNKVAGALDRLRLSFGNARELIALWISDKALFCDKVKEVPHGSIMLANPIAARVDLVGNRTQ